MRGLKFWWSKFDSTYGPTDCAMWAPFNQNDENEYEHIMAVLDRDGGFGHHHSDPAFYVRFPTLEARRAARDKFAQKCLICGEDAHFARDCPKQFMNVSALIDPDVGSSNATETE